MQPAHPSEESPLLHPDSGLRGTTDAAEADAVELQPRPISNAAAIALLPVPLLAALAMAATAATTIYAYATLTCRDATTCDDAEVRKYAGTVAVATTVANLASVLSLGPFERLSRRTRKGGLLLWTVSRSTGVAILALGVYYRSIAVALSGQIFEGFASDNILQFNLNAVYVQTSDKQWIPRLIGASLGLYMIGISVSPTLASLLGNFQRSFAMALAFFLSVAVYLLVVWKDTAMTSTIMSPRESQGTSHGTPQNLRSECCMAKVLFGPFQIFQGRAWAMLPAISLFLYNLVQAYTFQAVMVHTSIALQFSSRENGFLLSIAHAVSSAYLLSTSLAGPLARKICWLSGLRQSRCTEPQSNREIPTIPLALFSLALQAAALALFGLVTQAWQAYCIAAVLAIGLTAPSFIKAYYVTLFSDTEATKALAALSWMEVLSGLLAPPFVGTLQALLPNGEMFFVMSTCVALAAISLAVNRFILKH